MKGLSRIMIGLALVLLPASSALSYQWQHVRVDSVDSPTYEIQFGGFESYAGTEVGVFRGLALLDGWEGMGLDYPGLGAHSILYLEGAGWIKHVINEVDLPGATGVAIGDVGGSGHPDVVVAAKDPGDRVVWFQNPLPDLVTPLWTARDVESPAWGAREVCIDDIDGDDDLDIAAALRDEDMIVWYAAGTEHDPVSWTRHNVGIAAGPRGVFIADINEDDRLDLVAGGMNAGEVLWFQQPEDPTDLWPRHVIDSELPGVKGVYAFDIDRDDDLDVVAAGRDTGQVVWYEQVTVGPDMWVKHIIDDNLPGAVSVWCGDLVGDRLPEVAATSKFDGIVVVYEQPDDVNDVWNRTVIDENLAQACPISGGDFDGDGRTDLVAAGKSAGVVAWYKAPDDVGMWQKFVIDDLAGPCMGITAGDVDLDGDFDVASTSIDGSVNWYENDLRDIYCAYSEGSGACESDGVYKWHDTSQEWVVSWWCPRPFFLAEHPLLPDRFYCGTHEGLFASDDMAHWSEVGEGSLPDTVRCIWFDSTDPLIMMAGTDRGLYRSNPVDPGWSQVVDIPPLPVMDIESCWPSGPWVPMVFASVGNGSLSDGVFRSYDFGETWDCVLTFPQPTDLLQDHTAHDPPVMFVGTAEEGILRMDAEGQIVGDLNAGLPEAAIHRMRYDPYIDTPAIYGCTQEGLYLCLLLQPSDAPDPPVIGRPLCRVGPNPWRSEVAFRLSDIGDGDVIELCVFDVAGRRVWSSKETGSSHGAWTLRWNGRDARSEPLSPGVYFYRLEVPGGTYGGKVVRAR